MPEPGSVVVIGGTQGLGLEVARHYAGQGRQVVLSGRDPERAAAVAGEDDLAAPAGVVAGHLQTEPLGAADHDHASLGHCRVLSAARLLRRAGSGGTPSRG